MVELYVNDIANALKNKSYFSALAMSLALPDICGTAEYPNETSTAKRYIEWYNKYLGEYMSDDRGNPYLSGEIVYNLRNLLHRPKRKPNGITKADREASKSDDLLKRDFTADVPLKKCVTDITEIKAKDGKLYVSAIFDCYDLMPNGLAMADHLRAELCCETLKTASLRYPEIPEPLCIPTAAASIPVLRTELLSKNTALSRA